MIKRILVTGASGFLGNRLTECLLRSSKTEVRAMAHSPGGASQLARMNIEIAWCDITDPAQVRQAIDGCDAVVHCAYGASGNADVNRDITVRGTRVLAEAAAEAGVKAFVHISSVAVYSYSPNTGVTEDSPLTPGSDAYCRDKADAEKQVLAVSRSKGLNAVILRMGNIYGPNSAPWTLRPLAHIKEDMICLVDGGEHASNMVSVDNAVQCILLALTRKEAIGASFFVTDDTMSWRDLYGTYAEWLGKNDLESVSSDELNSILSPSFAQKMRRTKHELVSDLVIPIFRFSAFRAAKIPCLASLTTKFWRSVPRAWKRPLLGPEKNGSPLIPAPGGKKNSKYPPLGLLEVYAGKAVFSNEKAKHLLGYDPCSNAESLRLTKIWAEWARLL